MAIDERTKDRIRKLLALATSSNEHEAAVAMAKAQELIIRHAVKPDELNEDRKRYILKQYIIRMGMSEKWRGDLINVIFQGIGGKVIIMAPGYEDLSRIQKGEKLADVLGNPDMDLRVGIVAKPETLEVGIWLYEFIRPILINIASSTYSEQKRTNKYVAHRRVFMKSFYVGAVDRIADRLEERRTGLKKDAQIGALVMAEDFEVEKAFREMFPQTTKGNGDGKYYDMDAMNLGAKEADSIPLGEVIHNEGHTFRVTKSLGAGGQN